MTANEAFAEDEVKEYNNADISGVWSVTKTKEDKVYNYEEAIDLAGNGLYTLSLLGVLSLTILAMGCDMFGFSVVVAGSQCDLELTPAQRNILMSMPFLGPIFMSYPWGYFSDTRGRQRCLLLAMSIGFVTSVISALSPHWVMLAVLKFLSTSCASCAQSATYALIGESSPLRVRTKYMLVMTSVLMLTPTCYFLVGYFILNTDFSLNLGAITFVPWRLLVLTLALPMGISAVALLFFYESPKFLANAGQEQQAVDVLEKIWRRNGGKHEFPVKKIVLKEDSAPATGKHLLRSLWQQTAPLFQRPLLWRTLQLYYITAVLYSINNSLLMWYPFIANAVLSGDPSVNEKPGGLCDLIVEYSVRNTTSVEQAPCSSRLEYLLTIFTVVHSISFALLNALMSRFAGRMKVMMLVILTFATLCGVGVVATNNKLASFAMFMGIMTPGLGIGVVFSYFIELYPTSYRGMVACLGVIVARGGSLIAINIVGTYLMTQCHICFYAFTAYIFSGLVASIFLPADGKKKT